MKYLIICLTLLMYACAVDTGTSVTEADIEKYENQSDCEKYGLLGCDILSSSSYYNNWWVSSSSITPTKTLNLGTDIIVSNFHLYNGIKIVFKNNFAEYLSVEVDYSFKCSINNWQETGTLYFSLQDYEIKELTISYINYCTEEQDYGIITITAIRPMYDTAKKYITWHGESTYYTINF